jgi:phosphoglycolate phosphatase
MDAPKAILFDFDGTLADTAPDMARAANTMLTRRNRPPAPYMALRPQVSRGARGMVTAAFGIRDTEPEFPALRKEFLDTYYGALVVETALFDGVDHVLGRLAEVGIAWGIVTNKESRYAHPIFRALGLDQRTPVRICGDSTPHVKPHPAPLLAGALALGVAPHACWYVGDDIRDAEAAAAAGMPFITARYGYLGADARPEAWKRHAEITDPLGLLALLTAGSGPSRAMGGAESLAAYNSPD